jgi:antitoxin Phd
LVALAKLLLLPPPNHNAEPQYSICTRVTAAAPQDLLRSDQNVYILVSRTERRFAVATWQVQDAKTRLSEVIERARTEGPQTITRHGAERAVVLSIEDYRALVALKPDFKAYLLGGPKVDDFPIERDRDAGRSVEL